ncbi:hypothetical protein QYE76_046266 [Lolium multiflorum]|uniref:Uncharacterized protein n=1 Tax=Lolium multiflorum TaxID=4521 RepID=A0AAD8TPL9_LOLMU|nr:hypothetical protein QYE76_046266 [Lolium multiflorum]
MLLYIAPSGESRESSLRGNDQEGKSLSGEASRRCLRWLAVLDIFGSFARVTLPASHARKLLVYTQQPVAQGKEGFRELFEGKSLSGEASRRCLRWLAVLDIFGSFARVTLPASHARKLLVYTQQPVAQGKEGFRELFEGKSLSGEASRRCLRWLAVLDIFGSFARVTLPASHARKLLVYTQQPVAQGKEGFRELFEGKSLSGEASRRCLRWLAVLDIFGSFARVTLPASPARKLLVYIPNNQYLRVIKEGFRELLEGKSI